VSARSAAVDRAVDMVRREGLNPEQAARRAGCTSGAVRKRLRDRPYTYPTDTRRKRAWADAHRVPCTACGKPRGAGTAAASGAPRREFLDLCPSCRQNRRVERAVTMARLRIDHDMSNERIARHVGITEKSVAVELSALRAAGYWVPFAGRLRHVPARASDATRRSNDLRRALAARGHRPPNLVQEVAR
jgi:hypothetical protein